MKLLSEAVHVYPLSAMPDMAHAETRDHDRVSAPQDDCWLCREGICTQLWDTQERNVVVHGTATPN